MNELVLDSKKTPSLLTMATEMTILLHNGEMIFTVNQMQKEQISFWKRINPKTLEWLKNFGFIFHTCSCSISVWRFLFLSRQSSIFLYSLVTIVLEQGKKESVFLLFNYALFEVVYIHFAGTTFISTIVVLLFKLLDTSLDRKKSFKHG